MVSQHNGRSAVVCLQLEVQDLLTINFQILVNEGQVARGLKSNIELELR
jgi:hypothetical protein